MAEGRKCIEHVHSFVSAWGPVCIYGVFGSWTSSWVSVFYLLLCNNIFRELCTFYIHAWLLGVPYFQQCCDRTKQNKDRTKTVILKNIITAFFLLLFIILCYCMYCNLFPWWQSWFFKHHYSLQCHMILQNSFKYADLALKIHW